MPLVSPTQFANFFTAMQTRFNMMYGEIPSWVDRVATTVPVNTEFWVGGWMSEIDGFRQWKGDRVYRTPAAMAYMVTIPPWELTVELDKFKFDDDTYGIYAQLPDQIAKRAREWPMRAIVDLIQGNGDFAGLAQQGLDGVNMWSGAHPVDYYDAGKGTYVNDYGTAGVSVNGITVGGYFSPTAFTTIWADMAARKNEAGEIASVIPDLVLVPPQLTFEAKAVLQMGFFSPQRLGQLGTGNFPTAGAPVDRNAPMVGAMENPLNGACDVLTIPQMANQPTAWYVMASNDVNKPLLWVQRQGVETVARTAPTDDPVFQRHAYQWGAWARAAPAWGPSRLIARSGIDA